MNMENNNSELHQLANQAQAFLFVEGGTLSVRKLTQLLHATPETTHQALVALAQSLQGSGLALVQTETEATLTTSEITSSAVLDSFEKELGREIGEAGLEALAIVLYLGPKTRADIDYIRGVNTSSTIRSLLSRGLIERIQNPSDSREYLYRPTGELLAHLGVTNVKDLPDYDKIIGELVARTDPRDIFEEHHGNTEPADTGKDA